MRLKFFLISNMRSFELLRAFAQNALRAPSRGLPALWPCASACNSNGVNGISSASHAEHGRNESGDSSAPLAAAARAAAQVLSSQTRPRQQQEQQQRAGGASVLHDIDLDQLLARHGHLAAEVQVRRRLSGRGAPAAARPVLLQQAAHP